jgi:hypothetical protein
LEVGDAKANYRQVVWGFLVHQGLVRDSPDDSDTFINLVRKETDRGPITGFSIAKRIAIALEDVGITLPTGNVPDPWARIAKERARNYY